MACLNTPPHVYVTMWKYLRNGTQSSCKERRRGFSNRSNVEAAMTGKRCVFLCESKSTLFGLMKVDAIRNHWLRFVYNRTAQPKCSNLCNAFYGRQFHEPSIYYNVNCGQRLSKRKRVNSDFALTIWRFWISDCKYVLFLVQVFAIDCSNVEFCA